MSPVGSYSLTAKATDDMTATATSTAITVNIIVNQSPSITLTTPLDLATNAGTGGTVTLTRKWLPILKASPSM